MQQLVEGAFLVLLGSAIPLLFIALIWLFQGADSGILKFALLTLACTSWALLWIGAWKLSTPSLDPGPNRFDLFWTKALRVTSLIMLFFPVPWGLAAMWRKVGYWDWELTYLQALFIAGVASAAIFYQNLRQLVSRANARLLQGMAYLSLAGVIFVQYIFPGDMADLFYRAPNSLTFMCFCPSPILGPQITPAFLFGALRYDNPDGWPILAVAASIAVCATTMIFIMRVFRARYHGCQKLEARLIRRRQVTNSRQVTSAHSQKTQ